MTETKEVEEAPRQTVVGTALAIDVGLGVAGGIIAGGGAGIALGISIGAGLGVACGTAWDALHAAQRDPIEQSTSRTYPTETAKRGVRTSRE